MIRNSGPASELLDSLWQQQMQADEPIDQAVIAALLPETDAEGQAEVMRDQRNASAYRGMLFGVPLAIVLWALPTMVWLASGNIWLGALACVAEFAAMGWAIWLWRGPRR